MEFAGHGAARERIQRPGRENGGFSDSGTIGRICKTRTIGRIATRRKFGIIVATPTRENGCDGRDGFHNFEDFVGSAEN